MANQQLRDQVEDYKNRQHKKRRLKRISFGVAICLVAVAIVGLVLPAVTLEYGKTSCGKEEHAHTEQCVTRTLACTLSTEGHVHTASCFDELGALACAKQAAGHMHLASCVDPATNALACGQEETVHVHTAGCINPATNTLACNADDALHVHGDTCYTMQNGVYTLVCQLPSAGHVHTAVCLDELGQVVCGQQEAVEMNHQHGEDCYTEDLTCGLEEHVHTDLCYDEITQSIMKNEEKNSSSDAEEATEGEDEAVEPSAGEADLTAGEIAEAKDQGLLFENEAMIVAFDVPDDIKDKVALTVTEGSAADAGASQPVEGVLEGANVTIAEQATIDDQTPPPDAGDAAAAGNAADSTASAKEDAVYASSLHIQATLDGEPVEDLSGLGIVARLQMKPTVIAPILAEIDYNEVADEIKDEVGAELTIVQDPVNIEAYSISERPDEQVDEAVITSTDAATTAFDVASPEVTVTASRPANPTFTVQYYAYVDELVSEDGELTVIDTSAESNGGTAKLPTNGDPNGSTLATKKLALEDAGLDTGAGANAGDKSDVFKVRTNTVLEEMYRAEECQYILKPNPAYFNKLQENDHYVAKEIWVLKAGADPASVNPDDWYIYDISACHFTNRQETAATHPDFVLVQNGTVVRIVNDSRGSEETSPTTFYDYDITDGQIYTGMSGSTYVGPTATSEQADDQTWYANTAQQGINSPSNYGSGSKLAFGNSNTNSGLADQTLNGSNINMTNKLNGYSGCSFGLVSGLDADGNVVYASGLAAPDLFSTETTTGKTVISNSELDFARNGDTYTLTGATVDGEPYRSDLNRFYHPSPKSGTLYSNIYTNNFWPMDLASTYGSDGHDLKFGSQALAQNRRWGTSSWSLMPAGDDGQDHNAYFGMKYEIDFDLSADYCGPLEYLFFGDDDLWVFLDGKLVLDIGGVHSSVGEYVNLWDYIPGGRTGLRDGAQSHRLSIFYTERGASGSTCFMNFTLPSVSFAHPDRTTGSLEVKKEIAGNVDAADAAEEFEFTIQFKDAEGTPLYDDFSYTRYNSDGSIYATQDDPDAGRGLIVWDGGTFAINADQYIVIENLPLGTQFEIEERNPDRKWSAVSSLNLTQNSNETISGSISDTSCVFVRYKNTRAYELPATGGIGDYVFWIGGGALIAFAVVAWRRRTVAARAAATYASPSGNPESAYGKGRHRA